MNLGLLGFCITLFCLNWEFCFAGESGESLDVQIRAHYRNWRSENPTKSVLDYADDLKSNKKNDRWAMAVLNGVGVGGIRSTPATEEERKKILILMQGLGSYHNIISDNPSDEEYVKGHKERLRVIAFTDLAYSDGTPLTSTLNLDPKESLSLVREFWKANVIVEDVKAARAGLEIYGASGGKSRKMVEKTHLVFDENSDLSAFKFCTDSGVNLVRDFPSLPLVVTRPSSPLHPGALLGVSFNLHSGYALQSVIRMNGIPTYIVISRPFRGHDPVKLDVSLWSTGEDIKCFASPVQDFPSFTRDKGSLTLEGINPALNNAVAARVKDGSKEAITLHLMLELKRFSGLLKRKNPTIYDFLVHCAEELDEISFKYLSAFFGLIN